MAAPQSPKRITLTATRPALVTSDRFLAVYRGDDYEIALHIDDLAGSPFNLGYSTGVLNWTMRATLRPRVVARGGEVKAEAACSVSALSTGDVSALFPAEQTATIRDDRGVFDFEMQNGVRDADGNVTALDPRFALDRVFTPYTTDSVDGTDDGVAFYGDVSRSPELEPSDDEGGSTSDDDDGGTSLLGLANALSTGASTPAEDELGVFKQTVARVAYLNTFLGNFGLVARLVGNSIRIGLRPTLFAPSTPAASGGYADVFRSGSRRSCGHDVGGDSGAAAYLPTRIADNHNVYDAGRYGYPYGLWTAYDYYLLPHARHKRLRSTSLGADTGVIGYEYGHRLEAGDGTLGRKMVWDVEGACENAGYTDAFWDWCLDINPSCVAGAYVTTNRMRMVSAALLTTWVGEARFKAHIELAFTGGTTHAYVGEFTIYDTSGAVLLTWKRTGTDTFNWLTSDAKVQLRWRCDKDLARLDTFNAQYQGNNQGGNLLRIHVERYELRYVGFGGSK